MKVYIAGKITGLDNYKELFDAAEDKLKAQGDAVMNPSILPDGFEHEEYMKICYSMIDVCDVIYMLSNWDDSKGATMERKHAIKNNKLIIHQGVSSLRKL